MSAITVPDGARRGVPVAERLIVPGAIAVAVLVLDQIAKAAVADWLGRDATRHRWELLDAVLALEYVENTGAAFGLWQGGGGVLTAAGLAVVAGLMVYYLRAGRNSVVLAASLGLLVGGGIGNLVDRVRLGYVVDFVAVGVWPKFNIADSAVTCGVLLLAWHLLGEGRLGEGAASGDG